MAKRTCLIDGCEHLAQGRGLCSTHYWHREIREQYPVLPRGKDAPDFAPKYGPTCTVEGCDRTHRLRGLCSTHYTRWRTTGEIGGPIEPRQSNKSRVCSVEVCDRPARTRGYCEAHYQGLLNGEVLQRPVRPRTERLEVVTYSGMHARLKRDRGLAANHFCADCGRPAEDWSYDNEDGDELRDELTGLPYSLDASHYAPRCKPCHMQYDRTYGIDAEAFRNRNAHEACLHGHAWTVENTYLTARGSRRCRACARIAQGERRARQAAD